MCALPGRASDAGPDGGGPCPRCGAAASGKGSWNTKGDCHTCGDPCCDACSVVDEQGLVCAGCVALAVKLLYQFGDVTEVVN